MSYINFWLTASGETVRIYPQYGFNARDLVQHDKHRTQGGQLNAFSLVTSASAYMLPVSDITSGDAHTIKTWWRDMVDVTLTVNDSVDNATLKAGTGWFELDDAVYGLLDQDYNPLGYWTTITQTIRIMNRMDPLPTVQTPWYFSGVLNLRTI